MISTNKYLTTAVAVLALVISNYPGECRDMRTNPTSGMFEGVLQYVLRTDQNKCMQRFFCEVGARGPSFGRLGDRIASLLGGAATLAVAETATAPYPEAVEPHKKVAVFITRDEFQRLRPIAASRSFRKKYFVLKGRRPAPTPTAAPCTKVPQKTIAVKERTTAAVKVEKQHLAVSIKVDKKNTAVDLLNAKHLNVEVGKPKSNGSADAAGVSIDIPGIISIGIGKEHGNNTHKRDHHSDHGNRIVKFRSYGEATAVFNKAFFFGFNHGQEACRTAYFRCTTDINNITTIARSLFEY